MSVRITRVAGNTTLRSANQKDMRRIVVIEKYEANGNDNATTQNITLKITNTLMRVFIKPYSGSSKDFPQYAQNAVPAPVVHPDEQLPAVHI
jgi:hypothetical protein